MAETPDQRRQLLSVRLGALRLGQPLLGLCGLSADDEKPLRQALEAYEEQVRAMAGDRSLADAAAVDAFAAGSEADPDAVDRLVSIVEERFLAADDSITRSNFETLLKSGNAPRKALLGYGRVLVCRRLGGARSDRFEHLATQLLSEDGPEGRRTMIGRDAAKEVLRYLIGGLDRPADEVERRTAVHTMNDARKKLGAAGSFEEVEEGGLLLDTAGYRMTVREHLLSADFLFACAAYNVAVSNKVESWATTPEERTRIHTALREMEQLVHDTFGDRAGLGKRTKPSGPMGKLQARRDHSGPLGDRTPSGPLGNRTPPGSVQAPTPRTPQRRKKPPGRPKREVRPYNPFVSFYEWLKDMVPTQYRIFVLILVVLLSTGSLFFSTGVVDSLSKPEVVPEGVIRGWSPLLTAGFRNGRTLNAEVRTRLWKPLDAAERRERAQAIRDALTSEGIYDAVIRQQRRETREIVIEDGKVTHVHVQ